ncbi:hypothetical protein LYSIN_01200 [Lysinibacillus sphaericus]|uniref:Uncharacterized protein n=1 Tax=Lysinibacillus sphaericus TaxID=1421 RepID=A0A2S5D093_LYSSH|nr:hypothetical protein [Lysinibacillus sphaericus]POZ56417.1 hypothetical protein LYSIN_01200 [Lysinibacillus sphaericus]
MSSHYSVLSPNFRGTKKFNLLVLTRIVVESDFTDYQGVKLLNRDALLICDNKFNRIPVKANGEDSLLEVKEASYTVLEDNYNLGVIDALISFDVFANSTEEAVEKMRRTLEGDIVIKDFALSEADTDNMEFDCDVLLYQFDHNYLIKEITKYDEMPKKYEQFASLKVVVRGDIPYLGERNEPYKFDELLGNQNYKFDNFNLSIDGLRNVNYNLSLVSFETLEEGVAEFNFCLKFNNILGFGENHASDQFESIFRNENIKFSDFVFKDDENFIASKLEVKEIIESSVEDLAVKI